MTTEERKVQIVAEVDATPAQAGFENVKASARDMAQAVTAAGQQAGEGIKRVGEGADPAAASIEKSARSIVSSIRRVTSEQERALAESQAGTNKTVAFFEALSNVKGIDVASIEPFLEKLKQVESHLGLVKAREQELAETAAFDKKAAEAAKLVQASEYVRLWETLLKKADEQEKEFAHSAAFNQKAAEAASLVKASEYVRFWEDELKKAELAEQEFAHSAVFNQKATEAAKLVKASEYVRFWEDELQKVEETEKRLLSQNSFIANLKAQSEAIGKSRADLLEMKASQLGVAGQAKPFIDALRQQEESLVRGGAAAKQMQWALQGLPAQLTDIVVSLSSGQQPFTVFLQQGGQLKDMFGGVGNAARALGGYVVGLINPFTLAAAGASILAVAYYQGSKEADAYNRALILTGNAAGTTSAQLQDMAAAIAAAIGSTHGAAAEAIAAAAGTGKVAAGNIELVSQAAIKLNKAVGLSIQSTIDDFAELGKEPVKASEKLNEKYNYLTASVYGQIKALEDQGKTLEAATLAQKAYADAMSTRADAVVQNLGTLERAWKGIVSSAKSGWDAMLGVGRQVTLSDQIAEQRKTLDAIRSGAEPGNIDIAQKHLAALEAMSTAQGKAAAATADANRHEQARLAWIKDSDKYLSKAEQMERAITKARNDGAAAGVAQSEIEKRIARIREDMTEKAKKPAKSQDVKDAEDLERILSRINGTATGLDAGYYTDLKKLFAAYGSGKITLDQYRDAVEKLTVSQKFHKDTLDAQAKAQKEAEKAQSDYFNHWQKYLGSLDQEAQKLEEQAALWGLSKQAIAEMAVVRAEETLAKARDNNVGDEYIAKLEQELELRRRIASATGSVEAMEANRKAATEAAREWQRVSDDVARALTDSIFRGGKTGWEQLKKTIEATLIRAYIQPIVQQGLQAGTDVLGWLANAGLGWLSGSASAGSTGSTGTPGTASGGAGQGGQLAGYANTLGTLNTLYKVSAALYAKIAGTGTAAGGTGLTLGAGGQTGLTLGSGGATGMTAGSGAAASPTGLSAATVGWVAAIAVGMYMSSNAWKSGLRADGHWATNDPKSWPMRFWDNDYYVKKAMFGKEFAGSELYAILSGNSLSRMVHEAIFGSAKRYTGDYALRAIVGPDGTDTEVGAHWKKKGGLFGGSKSGIRWSAAEGDIDTALESIIDSVKTGMVKLGHVFDDTTLADKIARFTGTFDTEITGTLQQAFTVMGQKVRDGLAASLFPSIEALRKTTDANGKQTTEAWSDTFTRVLDESTYVVGMIETMGRSVANTFGKNNADRVLSLSDALVTLFGSLDTLKQQFDGYYQAYYSSAEKLKNIQLGVAKTFADLGLAIPSTRAEFRTLVEGLDLASAAGQTAYASLIGVAGAFGTVADAIEAPLRIAAGIHTDYATSRRNLRYGIADDTGKYTMLDQEAARYMDVLRSLTDPELIQNYAAKLNETISTAWNLVPAGLQADQADAFLARYDQAESLIQTRLQAARQKTIDDQQAMAATIGTAIVSAFAGVAPAIEDAAKTIPRSISISVQAASGLAAQTEIGY